MFFQLYFNLFDLETSPFTANYIEWFIWLVDWMSSKYHLDNWINDKTIMVIDLCRTELEEQLARNQTAILPQQYLTVHRSEVVKVNHINLLIYERTYADIFIPKRTISCEDKLNLI